MDSSAVISPDRHYRYWLTRGLTDHVSRQSLGRMCLFIMLNPSTAGAAEDDPTIRRCKAYAGRWGFDTLGVVNLFALRVTDPKMLLSSIDPVGPKNDKFIRYAASRAARIVVAWGAYGDIQKRGEAVYQSLANEGHSMYCLRRTKAGHPAHPLYLSGNLQPVPYGGLHGWKSSHWPNNSYAYGSYRSG